MSATAVIAKSFHESSATLFLSLLVAGDFAFIGLHVLSSAAGRNDSPLNLDLDRGYPELYQYVKFFWICMLLAYSAIRQAAAHYFAWVWLFAYLLLDDALRIHETGGKLVAGADLGLRLVFDLRLQDYGELVVSAAAGAALLLPIAWAYRNGTPAFRGISRDLGLLMALLLFFGVVVDTVHAANRTGLSLKGLFEVIEEGGEMVSVSLILWYVFLLAVRPNDLHWRLADLAWSFLGRGRAVARSP